MNEQYLLYLNNFKSHLEQLKICKTKVYDRCEKAVKLQKSYEKYLAPIKQKIEEIFNDFEKNLSEINAHKLNEYSTSITFLREENNFYINSFDVLSSGENDMKKSIKNEISKINYLVDAAVKLKLFIVDRFGKIVEKYADEDHSELEKIKAEAVSITDDVNIKASLLNAQTTFVFTGEMIASSKLQSLEATINELSKRFASIG